MTHTVTRSFNSKDNHLHEEVEAILLRFNCSTVGTITKENSLYKSGDPHAVPVERVEVKFKVYGSRTVQ